jgi:hypothetical protein
MSEDTFRLIYQSRYQIPSDQHRAEIGTLFGKARSNNKKLGITGELLVFGDAFVQALEGDETIVRDLFATIEKDYRHDSVAVVEAGGVPERVFSKWSMARVSEDGAPDITLIAHVDGIHRAATRDTTPEQETVLDVMREAARSGSHAN